MKNAKKGSKADVEPQNNEEFSVDISLVEEESIEGPQLKERDIESLQHFFGKRKLEPFDNSEILRCRLLYQLKSAKYRECYTIVNKNTGKSLGIVPRMQLRHSWRMAHSKDAQKAVKNKLFFMTYEEWQEDADKLDKYIKAKRNYYERENEVLFSEVWSLSETEFEHVGLKRPQQFMALLQTAILGEIEETRRTLSAWKRLKKYIHKVPLEASLGGIFSSEDAVKLKSRLKIKWLNDIRKLNIFKLKNAMLEFDFEKIVKDINRAYKADLARRKDFRYKVHPFVAAFSNLAIVIYYAYNFKYTLIKTPDLTQFIMLLLSLCVLDTLIILIGGLRGRRRRLVRPGYVYYSPKVKKAIKWYACIGLFTVLSVLVFYQRYDGYDEKVYYRDLDDGTISIAGLVDPEITVLNIPATVDEKEVTKISPYAFYNGTLAEVSIPAGVTAIKTYAFANCESLHKVSMSDGSVDIAKSAFRKSAVTNLTLPENGDVIIGNNAFRGCQSLTNVKNMQNVTKIGDSAFRDCYSLTSFELSDKLTAIGSSAFMNCSYITSLTIPSSVESIGKKAIYYCDSLDYLAIPFAGTTAEESLKQNIDKIIKFSYPSLQKVTVAINSAHPIGSNSFRGLEWLAALELQEAVTSIPAHAFENNYNLKTVKMTTNLVEIGEYAFQGATNLESVTGADGVHSVHTQAFSGCESLKSIDFAVISNIGQGAFASCYSLNGIGDLSSLATVASYAFNGCHSLNIEIITGDHFTEVAPNSFANSAIISFTAKEGLVKIGANAFENCTSLQVVNLPTTLKEVDDRAFFYCTSLYSIDLSKTAVKTFGAYAFANCNNLNEITLGSSTTAISDYMFFGCFEMRGLNSIKNLASLSIETIGVSAFENSGANEAQTIPGTVKTIGSRAFASTNIREIVVPDSVTSIGSSAFVGCNSLKVATMPFIGSSAKNTSGGYASIFGSTALSNITLTNVTSIASDALKGGASSLQSITLPEGIETLPASLFENFTALTSVNIPSSVTSIGNNAFRNCYALSEISIPSGVSSIGSYAFENCRALRTVEIPTKITVINDGTFKNCTALRNVNFNTLRLTGIGVEAFMNDYELIFDGTFNAGLVSIGARAFAGCNFTQVVIDKSTTKMDRDAFGGNVDINIFVPKELLEQYTELFEKYDNVKIKSV